MTLAFGYSERMVETGTLGWKDAVALAMAKARTTWSMPARSSGLVGLVGCHLTAISLAVYGRAV
jgi:hypothetical protein